MASRPPHDADRDGTEHDAELPPALLRGGPAEQHAAEHHHEVVVPVRDVTRPVQQGGSPRSAATRHQHADPATSDTAFRIAFPFTYDIVLDRPDDEVTTGEDA